MEEDNSSELQLDPHDSNDHVDNQNSLDHHLPYNALK